MKKTKKNSDKGLIAKIKEGDTLAFQQFVNQHKDVSFSLAYSILKDKHWAEDVLQETFIKVYRRINSYKGRSEVSTWLYRIVVNTCFSVIRREKRYTDYSNDYELEAVVPKDFSQKEKAEVINKALDFLKVEESLVLKLFYLSELSVKEIKEITKFKESKIKVTLHRGRKSLEEVLGKMLGKEIKSLL